MTQPHRLLLLITLPILLNTCAYSQNQKRIAINPFQDEIAPSQQAGIGQKLDDRLISRIADTGTYQVIERQRLDQVMEEQRLPHGIADDTTAVKIGKLVNVSVILVGSSSYDFNPNAREDAAAVYGSVTVSATARLISTETGAIIKAPTASGTAIGTIRLKPPPPPPPRDCAVILGHQICGPAPKPPATPQVQLKTPEQLLDEAIDYCSRSLVNQITMAPTSTTVASTLSVIGEADGLTYISKGSDAGLKVGQVLHVYRVVTCSATINSLGEQSCSYVQSGHQIGLARETIYYSP